MGKNLLAYIFIIMCYFNCNVKSWDTDELEIFDVVEEVNQNFYDYMGITQDASNQQLKRAFRNLSIIMHPDKSQDVDANIKFRNLVAIYDILKDPSKREKYDKVLKDGLPNWKSAVYYYRRVRKMTLIEMTFILCIIITIGQYLTGWAIYLERKYTAEQLFGTKKKRKNKANSIDINAILSEIPSPSIYNTLPFQIPRAIWYLPKTIKSMFEALNEFKTRELEKRRLEIEEQKRLKLQEEELAKEREAKKELKETIRRRKQQQNIVPEKTDEELAGYSIPKIHGSLDSENSIRPITNTKSTNNSGGGLWTDEDLIELIRLVKKYPSGGTTNRWEIISEIMNRTVAEITFMAGKLKENGYRVPGYSENTNIENNSTTNDETENEINKMKKEKSRKKQQSNTLTVPEMNWTQEQQKALEQAIIKYKKSSNQDRWQKISNCVPGKTREECLLRYKYIVELIKSQKQNDSEIEQKNDNTESETKNCDKQQQQQQNNNESEATIKADQDNIDKKQKIDDQEFQLNALHDNNSQIVNEYQERNAQDIPQFANNQEENINYVEEEKNENTKQQGKPRNKRKERKKRQEYLNDDDLSD